MAQLVLPWDGSAFHIGELEVSMPDGRWAPLGAYVLDVLDAEETSPARGAELLFGSGDDDPLTTWRAEFGDITGETFTSMVISEPRTALLSVLGAGTLLPRRR